MAIKLSEYSVKLLQSHQHISLVQHNHIMGRLREKNGVKGTEERSMCGGRCLFRVGGARGLKDFYHRIISDLNQSPSDRLAYVF